MGGIDLYLQVGRRRLVLRDALPIARAATRTPIVDGSGLKNTLERRVIRWLAATGELDLAGRNVLLMSGADRFGMAEALTEVGARVTFGDLAFTIGVPIALRSLRALELAGAILGPLLCRLPIEWLYPTGARQERRSPRFRRFFDAADAIAGDFHFIRRYAPDELHGKAVITNTVTRDDVDELRRRGVTLLVTTTPELDGRSFGTNVMEAVLVALAGKPWRDMSAADYERLLDRIGFRPRVQRLSLRDAPRQPADPGPVASRPQAI